MTEYTFATIPKWVAKVERRLTAIVRQSTNDLLVSIPIVPALARGGDRRKGVIPRDTGHLANSLQARLGSKDIGVNNVSTETSSYALVVGAMSVGDVASFVWSAEHAGPVHDERQWIPAATARWPDIVSRVVERAKGIN